MSDILNQISDLGIVPVVKIEKSEQALPLARALKEGGLPVAEITFRTDAAEEAIKSIANDMPDILLGAGTVLTVEQAEKAIKAGAKFIVSPGFNPEVVRFCLEKGVSITPGVSNPTDIEMALKFNLDVLKFFPAEAFGGLKTLKAISAPYGMVKFIPTGGVNAGNLNEYLAFNKVVACGGSWMVKAELISSGEFAKITELTREAVTIMLGFELAHVGINAADARSSLEIVGRLAGMFNMPIKEGNSSNFAGTGIEVSKKPGRGKNGHIAIKTNSISRAMAYLKRMAGIEIDMDTAKRSGDGQIVAVYLSEEIGGFAIHLLQKNSRPK